MTASSTEQGKDRSQVDEVGDASVKSGVEKEAASQFEAVLEALTALQPIAFDYIRSSGDVSTRRVQPWALQDWAGRWYLVGFDVDKGAERAFRLSRFADAVRPIGDKGSYSVPPDYEPDAEVGPTPKSGPKGWYFLPTDHGPDVKVELEPKSGSLPDDFARAQIEAARTILREHIGDYALLHAVINEDRFKLGLKAGRDTSETSAPQEVSTSRESDDLEARRASILAQLDDLGELPNGV